MSISLNKHCFCHDRQNHKEGTKTITFAEIEEAFGSDLSSLTAPEKSIDFDTKSVLFSMMFALQANDVDFASVDAYAYDVCGD